MDADELVPGTDNTDVPGAPPSGTGAEEVTGALASQELEYDRPWGWQTVVVEGMDARAQLREALGEEGLQEWATDLLGDDVDVDDPY